MSLTGQAAEGGEELIRLLRLGERRRRRLLQLLLVVPPRVERRGGCQGRVGAEGHAPAAVVVLGVAVVQEAVGDDAVGVVLMMVGVVTWVLVLVLVVALVQPSS